MKLGAWLSIALEAIVIGAAGILCYRYRGDVGLAGFGAGTALGLILCGLSHVFWKLARQAEGYAIVRYVMTAVTVTFGMLIAAVLLVRWLWPQALPCFALTAFAVYIVHRFAGAISAGMTPSGPASGEKVGAPAAGALTEDVGEANDR